MSAGWKALNTQKQLLDHRPVGTRRPGRQLERSPERKSCEDEAGSFIGLTSWPEEEEEEEEEEEDLDDR